MPREQSPGKPTTRRYSEEEKAAAVRMVRTLRAELGSEHGTVKRVAEQLGYGVESVRLWVPPRARLPPPSLEPATQRAPRRSGRDPRRLPPPLRPRECPRGRGTQELGAALDTRAAARAAVDAHLHLIRQRRQKRASLDLARSRSNDPEHRR
jgi:transposase